MTLSGGRNDTVMDNTFSNNGAWGFLFVPYPDCEPTVRQPDVRRDRRRRVGRARLRLRPESDALLDNTFTHNGYFGNDGNADFGLDHLQFRATGQLLRRQLGPERKFPTQPRGDLPDVREDHHHRAMSSGPLLDQVLCDTGFGACSASTVYPQETGVVMHPLPSGIPTMPDPCTGVPDNAWCASGRPIGSASS